jgi:hypothetical protein
MSAWLGRPNLIDQKNLNFKLPNLRLDQSTSDPNLLSPFAHMALQATLGRRMNMAMGDAQSVDALSADEILIIQAELDNFIDDLPPIFRVEDPDTSHDVEHPYFVVQRHQLHTVVYVTKLDFFKPFLTRARDDKKTDRDDEFRRMGTNLALDVLEVARRFFTHEFPINAKFHMVIFAVFDTSTILCSAIIHDHERRLPRRDEIMSAIDSSLDMLYQLSPITKIGATSYAFLYKLVQSHPELSRGTSKNKRARKLSSASTHGLDPPPLVHNVSSRESVATADHSGQRPASVPTSPATAIATVPIQTMPYSSDISLYVDQFLAQNPFGDATTLDMGGMEQIWDWQDLNLNQFPQ